MPENRLHVHSLRPLANADQLMELLDPRIALTEGDEVSVPPRATQVLVGGRPSRGDLEACSELRMLVVPYAGIPEATRELMLQFPRIAVHNLHHNASAAAELALALFLAAAKRVIPADRGLRSGDWSIRYADGGDLQLEGKTVLILGLGAVGSQIGRVCEALGLRVIGVKRHPEFPPPATESFEVHGPEDLQEILPKADALIVSLPLTPSTRGLLDEEALRRLPRHAVLVNVARGPIIEEKALFDALSTGQIAAAGLDVWYQYPRAEEEKTETYPSSFPFQELDNVVLSPHRGGAFNRPDLERLRIEHLAQLLNAAARGAQVPNRVDVEAGY